MATHCRSQVSLKILVCHSQGVYAAMQAAMLEYDELGAEDALDLIVEEETAHECTPTMWSAVLDWLQSALATK